MNRNEFLLKISDILQYEGEEELTFETELPDMEEWDSIAVISTAAFLNSEFGKKVTVSELQKIKNIEALAELAGI